MYLQNLYPKPSCMEAGEGVFTFGAKLLMETDADLTPEEIGRLKILFSQFTYTASCLQVRTTEHRTQGPVRAVLAVGRTASPEAVETRLSENRYELQVLPREIRIGAENGKALMEAFSTLVQLVEPECLEEGKEDFRVQAVRITDRTSMGFRAIHLCVFPETTPVHLKKAIRLAGFLKFTHVILEFWGMFPWRCLPELSWKRMAYSRKEVRELISEIRSWGMEVIPMINHLGHATQSRASRGRHVVLDQAPRYAKLFEPDGWTWCVTNPDTLKLLKEMREEMIELCGPGSYFHLGFDEAYSFATCPSCRKKASGEAELLADYINTLAADLDSQGRRSIIWHDELLASRDWPEKTVANGDHYHHTASAIDRIDRRVILADWQYDLISGGMPTSEYFMKKGFDVLLCPWDNLENVNNLCNASRQLQAMGMIFTTWDTLPDCIRKMQAVAKMMWEEECPAQAPQVPVTEAGSIFRKLMTGTDSYEQAGWNRTEVEI